MAAPASACVLAPAAAPCTLVLSRCTTRQGAPLMYSGGRLPRCAHHIIAGPVHIECSRLKGTSWARAVSTLISGKKMELVTF